MAIQVQGNGGTVAEVGAGTRAIRQEDRPIEVGSLGAYQVAASSGTVAAGMSAASTIFSIRWGDATRAMLVRRVSLLAQNAGTAFAAGTFLFDISIARSFTASDSAQTQVTLTGHNAKKRTSFGTSLVTDMRICNTGAITAGTRTLDAQPVAVVRGSVQATATNYVFAPASGHPMTAAAIAATGTGGTRGIDMIYPEIGNSWPIVLVQNEGIVMRGTVPGTGTWLFTVEVEWAEVETTAGYN